MEGRLPTPFRAGDVADLKFLLRKLGIGSIEEVEAIVTEFYGRRAWLAEKRWLVEQLLKEMRDE